MGKAASDYANKGSGAIDKVTGDSPLGKAVGSGVKVVSGVAAADAASGFKNTQKDIGDFTGGNTNDPFGAAAIQKEQDDRFDKAIQDTKDLQLESSSKTNTAGTSQTTFGKAGKTEQALTKASVDAFNAQKNLVNQQAQGIKDRQGLQTSAREGAQGILSGDAFNLSNSEQSRIDAMRGANIDASRFAVDELLNERLANLSADAASRGVRGQAFSQLQGDAVAAGARELNMGTLDANRIAAQQAIDLPGQRVGAQSGIAQNFAGFADAQQQQAIQNQQLLQDPIALAQARDERLRGGKTSTTGSTSTSSIQDVDPSGIILAKAGAPGEKGAKVAANQAAVGTAVDVAGVGSKFMNPAAG